MFDFIMHSLITPIRKEHRADGAARCSQTYSFEVMPMVTNRPTGDAMTALYPADEES